MKTTIPDVSVSAATISIAHATPSRWASVPQADHYSRWERGRYALRAVNTIDRATARWRSGVSSLRIRSMSCEVKSG